MIQTTQPAKGAQRPSSAPAVPDTGAVKVFQGWIVLWSSFTFAVLQSVCTAFAAISGLRLVLGLTSLASALGARVPASLHLSWIRIPMVLLALAGSLINLLAIRRIRRLRHRPAAQWRMQPMTVSKLRSERLQMVLAVATLGLLVVEEVFHLTIHHTL